MGVLGKISSQIGRYSEASLQDVLSKGFFSPSTKKYEMFNLYVFGWESDYLVITKSGLIYEFECKISKSDFLNDFKNKEIKHQVLGDVKQTRKPSYFYYCVPKGLLRKEDIPQYCGLIEIGGGNVIITKTAPRLHKEKANIHSLDLINKFYYNMISYRNENCRLKREVSDYGKGNEGVLLSQLKSRIKFLEESDKLSKELVESWKNHYEEERGEVRRLQNILKQNKVEYDL